MCILCAATTRLHVTQYMGSKRKTSHAAQPEGCAEASNATKCMQGISFRYNNHTPLAIDMIVSNEPGYYEDGKFGIRIENLAMIVEANTEFNFAGVNSRPAPHVSSLALN